MTPAQDGEPPGRGGQPLGQDGQPLGRGGQPLSQDGQPPGRDRDQAGRPRNARPRDAMGRPLRRGARGEPGVPDDLVLPPGEALALAQRLIDAGKPFQAHEVLEAAWKSAAPDERNLWQGLAQIAVGLTHAQRGNARGAAALLGRGAERVAGYVPAGRTAATGPHGIDVPAVVTAARALAGKIERDGLAAVTAGELRLRLPVRYTPGSTPG
jgi:hypothetical protein